MEMIRSFFKDYVAWLTMPAINIIDIIEILIIAFAVYHIIIWIKDTRAWALMKGIVVLFIVWLIAVIFGMNVLLWIFQNAMVIGITAINYFSAGVSQCIGTAWAKIIFIY